MDNTRIELEEMGVVQGLKYLNAKKFYFKNQHETNSFFNGNALTLNQASNVDRVPSYLNHSLSGNYK